MGSTRIAASPEGAMKREITTAKIGRSMKKRENILVAALLRLALAATLGRRSTRRTGWRGVRVSEHHRRAGKEDPRQAVHDHLVARLQAVADDPIGAGPLPDRDRARLRYVLVGILPVGIDVDHLALRAFHHRALRHRDRLRTLRA